MSEAIKIALDALKALGRVLQAGTPSIDTIHELGADCPMEEAWLIFHDEVRPCMAALEAMQASEPDWRTVVGRVCEGYTLPDAARKQLERLLYAAPVLAKQPVLTYGVFDKDMDCSIAFSHPAMAQDHINSMIEECADFYEEGKPFRIVPLCRCDVGVKSQ